MLAVVWVKTEIPRVGDFFHASELLTFIFATINLPVYIINLLFRDPLTGEDMSYAAIYITMFISNFFLGFLFTWRFQVIRKNRMKEDENM